MADDRQHRLRRGVGFGQVKGGLDAAGGSGDGQGQVGAGGGGGGFAHAAMMPEDG
jgi:hypothetical protein